MTTKSQRMLDAEQNTGRFHAVLRSINEFDNIEVHGVMVTLLSPTLRDTCFVGTYSRAIANVETLLSMTKSKDVQAIAMISRAVFELAVDIRLLEIVPNSEIKMLAYVDLEKLRAARRAIAFKKANPQLSLDTGVFEQFVLTQEKRIEAVAKSAWGGSNPKHWSELTLDDRAKRLKRPFDEIYAIDYSRVSWYAHPGLTGVVNVDGPFFVHLCASAFYMAAVSYKELLLTVIREYRISKATANIDKLLKLAERLPWTETQEQADELTRQARELRTER